MAGRRDVKHGVPVFRREMVKLDNVYYGGHEALFDWEWQNRYDGRRMNSIRLLVECLREMPLASAVSCVMVFFCYVLTLLYIVESLCPMAVGCVVLVLLLCLTCCMLMLAEDKEDDLERQYNRLDMV